MKQEQQTYFNVLTLSTITFFFRNNSNCSPLIIKAQQHKSTQPPYVHMMHYFVVVADTLK